ncbi:unnamed protein product [Sphagnum jensenii]|uniref:PHD-type domain-containing protein n=1 Tax=Sphagnum jensenii TaxID=128206 RepID=A0ABP1BGK6_9BRYO
MGITGGGGYVVGDGEKKLAEGARVEVRMTEKGLRGSWHPAVVTAVKPGTRVVEYEELVSDDGSGRKLKEMISVGRGVDGLRASSRQFSKTPPSSKRTRILLRPQPPVLSSLGKASWSKGLWVDVFWKDAWWEGILVEDILSERAGARAVVYFPDEGGQEMCLVKDLRLRQEWDEDTGNWSFKGRAELLELQDPSAFKKGPEFAVKKLNFDKKLPFFALTDDVGSPAGVAAKEGEKCRSGLASQRLERLKRKHGCPPNGRMGAPHASPDSSYIPAYCISNLLRGLEASAQVEEVAIVAGGVDDDSCSPPKEEQDGDCHPLQQLLAGTTKEKPTAKVMTATESKPPTTLSCNGKSNHNTEEEEEETHLSLLPQAIEHHPQAKKSRVSKGRETSEAAIHSHRDFKMAEIAMSLRTHEQQQVANPESRGNNSGASPKCVTAMSENVRNVMVLRNRQCKAVRRKESEVVELIEESRGDRMVLSTTTEKSCRKRVSIHNCSSSILEMEHRSKKNRWSSAASEEAAMATLAGSSSCLTHDEGMGGKKGVRKGGASSSSVHERRRKQKGARGGCRMEVLLSPPEDPVLDDGKNLYTKKNTFSWLIEAGVLHKDQKLRYMYRRKELGVGGWVTPEGVLCGCCNAVVTLSTFETHCGSKLHRPCANIFVEDGRSIAALQMEALKKQMSSMKMSSSSFHKGNRRGNLQVVKDSVLDVNDDTCGVCGDGGMLICCDHCPSTFHLKCMELMVVPEEDWYCPNCRCAICGGSQFNGSHDTFDEMSVLFCDQCEREFHVKCLYARGMPKMEQWPQNSWFCGNSCERIYRGLRGLVGTNNFLGEGFSWTLLRSQDEDPDPKTEVDKELLAEQNIKLSIALSVMQECFRPMIDPRTKVDVIAHALYNRGSDINRLNYHGFYTMILEKGDELISVAAIRVHGAVLAEMPLIGTRFQYRRQGMCRRLLHAIEQMLQMVGVETLVLPAVPELLDTWTGAFGFKPMDTFPRQTLIELNLMAFPGTSLLHKSLPGLQAHPPVKSARWVADAMNKLRRHSSTQAHASPVQTDLCCIGKLSEDEHIIDGEALPVTVLQSSSSSKLLAETDVKKAPHASSSLSEPETLAPSGSENLICLMLGNPKQKQKQNKKNTNKMDKEEQHFSDWKNVQGGEDLAVFCESDTNQTMQQDSGNMNTTNQLSDNPVQESLSLSKASSLLDSSPTSSLPSTAGQTVDDGLQKVVIIWEDTVVKMPPLATREGLKSREGMIDQAVSDGSFSIMPAVDADYQLLPMLKKRFDCTSSSSSDEMILYLDGLSSNQSLPTAVEVLPENRVGG